MSEIGQLLEILFQGIFNTWETMRNIDILGTDLLTICVTFLIANALVSLMIVVNHTKMRVGDRK